MRITVAVATLALAAATTACSGDDPDPTPVPTTAPTLTTAAPTTPPPSPTPTATPTLAAPTLPAAARADTPTGAESFARFYMTAQDYANRTGDTALLRSLGQCAGCKAVADGIDRFYRAGGRVEGGAITVVAADVTRHVPGQAALVTVTYRQAAGKQIAADGSAEGVPASTSRVIQTLRRASAGWTLTNIQGLS